MTKYRYSTFEKESHWRDCDKAIRSAENRHGIEIIELEVMENHAHMVAAIPPEVSVSRAIGLLKGSTPYELFMKHPNFRKTYRRDIPWEGLERNS